MSRFLHGLGERNGMTHRSLDRHIEAPSLLVEEQLKKFLETGLSGGFLDIDDPSTADPGTF